METKKLMRTMLLSFRPDVYDRIASGEKIFEYRRIFPEGHIKAYMYVSGPVCGIKGVLLLDNRHSLEEWRETYRFDKETIIRIN